MRSAYPFVTVFLVLGLTSALAGQDSAAKTDWNREGAARYLDARMDTWFAKGKKVRTGSGETVCISCHTVLPYVLARPVLRQAMNESAPTPHEVRIFDEVVRRVDTYSAHQPFYDFNEKKKAESRGTEAVLNALVLAEVEARGQRPEGTEALRKAFRRLWETQRADGAWDWLDFGLEPYETTDGAYYGATLAALAVAAAPSASASAPEAAAGVEKLRGYLQEKYARQRLFNQVWTLLAAGPASLLDGGQREKLIANLRGAQQTDGGWSLAGLGTWSWSKASAPFDPPGKPDAELLCLSDGYATGLVVYALRKAGLSTEDAAVRRGMQWLKSNQHDVPIEPAAIPAWRAHSLNFDREHGGDKGEPWRRMFMSDLATAFAALALSETP